MGVATFSIGLMPTYAQIGPWAAVALVVPRLIQGFGVGGEWGVVMALITIVAVLIASETRHQTIG
jgi:MFS family permease